jgi:hypothetical protein
MIIAFGVEQKFLMLSNECTMSGNPFQCFQNLKSFLHSCSIKAIRGRTVHIILYPTCKTQAKPRTFIAAHSSYIY